MNSKFYATTTPLEVFLNVAERLYPDCGEIEVTLGKTLPEDSVQGLYIAEKDDMCKIGISNQVYTTEKDIFDVATRIVCTRIARVIYPSAREDTMMCSVHASLILKKIADEIHAS